jgi:hypothetical protein
MKITDLVANSKFRLFSVLMGSILVFSSCTKIEDISQISANVMAGFIETDQTWTADRVYVLTGRVIVPVGVTLTIEPGTIIKGNTGEGSLASALVVAQGAKLIAVGTPDEPIIFTSVIDNIDVGQTSGTNLDENDIGLWGGLILLGSAPISGDADTLQIEGIPADDTYGRYGGQKSDDNSGVLKFISIRHGGTLLGEGNEINGLTLGGIGNGTSISNIEIVANKDDGIEFFGGNVSLSDILIWAQGDDAIDIDQGFSGTVNNFIYIGGNESDHALEVDGPEGTLTGKFILKNGTLKGSIAGGGEYADFRDGAMGSISNVYWWDFAVSADVELDDDVSSANYTNGNLVINGWEFFSAKLIDQLFYDMAPNPTSGWTGNLIGKVTIVNDGKFKSVGADISSFSWTYASSRGALDDF